MLNNNLLSTENKFKSVFDSSNDAIFLFNKQGVTDCNNKAVELFGYSKEILLHLKPKDLSPELQPDGSLSSIKSVEKLHAAWDGIPQRFFWMHSNSDGFLIPTEVYLSLFSFQGETFISAVIRDDTERYNKEKELEEQRLLYKSLVDTSPFPIYLCDERNLFFVNTAFEKLFEYSAEELLASDFNFMKLVDPEYHIVFKNNLNKLYQMGETKGDLYFTGITKSGKKLLLHTDFCFLAKERTYIQGITRDITQEIMYEESLFNSRQMLRFIFDNIPQRIYLKDKDSIYFSGNKQFLLDIGFADEQELIGLSDKDLPWRQYADEILLEDAKILSGDSIQNMPMELDYDGIRLIGKKTKVPLKNIKGEIIGILGTYEDVTDIDYFNTAILNSEIKYRSVFNNPHSPMFIIDPEEGCIVEANNMATEFYGYTSEEFTSMPLSMINMAPPEELREKLKLSIKNQQVFVFKHLKKDGSFADVEVHSGHVNIKGKDYVISIVYDITEKNLMIEELKRAKREAEEMNRLKSVFLANMSHELRTPLVGILGYSQIIRDEAAEQNIAMMGDTILKGGNRLLQTLNLILDLSRIEANRMETSLVKCNVSDVLKEVYYTFSPSAKLKNLSLNLELPEENIYLITDEQHLRNILNNLVNNALKFTEAGSISLSLAIKDDKTIFSVSDTGIGIPVEKQSLVFDAFRQASEGISRKFEGTGLGLTLTKKMVHLLGGEIEVQSQPGEGTTFKTTFPVLKNSEQTKRDDEEDTTSSTKRILIVEDEPHTYEVIFRYLKTNYLCTHATTGEDALELLKSEQYDLVLMDINLGKGITGVDVIESMKQVPILKQIPVIALTAYSMKDDIQNFLSKGFDQVLTKPFSKNMLSYTIQKYIM